MIRRGQTGITHQGQTGIAQKGDRGAAPPRFQLDYQSFRDLHKVLCFCDSSQTRKSRFACHLAIYFPDVADMDESDFGHLHLEVGVLKEASRKAIAKGEWGELSSHFAFVVAQLQDGGEELRQAIDVSYLGSLFYGETSPAHAKARSLLPHPLALALEGIERHYADQAGRVAGMV